MSHVLMNFLLYLMLFEYIRRHLLTLMSNQNRYWQQLLHPEELTPISCGLIGDKMLVC